MEGSNRSRVRMARAAGVSVKTTYAGCMCLRGSSPTRGNVVLASKKADQISLKIW